VDSSEADRFIEQLMQEAQTDPKLRALTYGSTPPTAGPGKPIVPESYPLVTRPYRTQQGPILDL
jgi:hypothetical protein